MTQSNAAMPEVTKLYLHQCPGGYCTDRWSKFETSPAEQQHLRETTSDDPIIHRHTQQEEGWVTQNFTIQDPLMRNHLSEALSGYQDFDADLVAWTFNPPFKPIVHRWARLNTLLNDSELGNESKHVLLKLIEFLKPIVAPSVDAMIRTKETGKVSFDDLWQIFPPGELVVTQLFGVETVGRVIKYREEFDMRKFFIVTLEYLDWNGERCGYVDTDVVIGQFAGFRRVVSLPVYPLSLAESPDKIRARLVERGRKFESLRGYHFEACLGTKILLGSSEARPVAGRIVIDAYAYYVSTNQVRPKLKELERGEEDVFSSPDDPPNDPLNDRDDDISYLKEGSNMAVAKSENMERVEVLDTLTNEQCLLATPWVRGLDLKTKDWAWFCVDDISPIVWNDDAFRHLVLPNNAKELAWSFAKCKALAKTSFDDFVQDKGRGIIILMFGPPGVGKTFTAEAVADRARVPLYFMSAGALGTVPSEVEASLERALDLCKMWNAMLLLDEADVFLGARSNVDLARNELVAVFLTKLEYYQGICFLTTNRMASLDHAFLSRVDLFLPYANLTKEARREVWSNFIYRSGNQKFNDLGKKVGDIDLDKLAELPLNGREIKNLIKSAHLLSLEDDAKIDTGMLSMLANNRLLALKALDEE